MTKLHIPSPRPAASLVSRPRLLARLNDGLPRKLTLVSAPAGFGKTTLVSDWINQKAEGGGIAKRDKSGEIALHPSPLILHPSKVAWLSLDEEDNDPTHFLSYLATALAQIVPEIDRLAQDMRQTASLPPLETLITTLINQIIATANTRFILVLDDYHTITTASIHHALTFLLNHQPPQLHVVITTRTDPPLPLARLRARGQLTELRETDLRFTLDEAAAFLTQVMRLNLSAADITTLDASTEGWAAGLQLAGLSLQGQPDYRTFLQSFHGSHRHIFDYLAAEVLKQQPETIREFLLKTSVLERLTGPLCDEVLGVNEVASQQGDDSLTRSTANSHAILEHLERVNLFIIPLDDERRWYRYHHLFAEFLQTCLQREQPHLRPELHRRAAAWYRRQGRPGDAIHHALAAADFDLAVTLIDQVAEELLKRGEIITLRGWLEALPTEQLYAHPFLCLLYGWILLFDLQLAEVEQLLSEVFEISEQQPLPADLTPVDIAAEIAAMRTWIAMFKGDPLRSAELAQQALAYPDVKSPFVRSMIAMNQIFPVMLNGDIPAAWQVCVEMVRVSREAGNILVAVIGMCQQAEVAAMAGRLHEAAEIYRQTLWLALSPSGQPLPTAGMAHIGLSVVLYEWNDLQAAARHLAQGLELTKQMGEMVALDGYILLTRLKQSQGDPAGA
ncbi:MAG: hypothetical protein EHM12_11550, partial [Dehalococcoidia bacterium]